MNKLLYKRWHKARFFSYLLQLVPFIRMIAVSGSLASNQSIQKSDIDLFIVGKNGHLWTVRFGCLFLTQILGQRAGGENTAGKICLNRFLSDSYLLVNPQNRYHAQEYSQIQVIFNTKNTYAKFISKNQWMRKYLSKKPESIANRETWFLSSIRMAKEFFLQGRVGNWLEKTLRHWQLKKINNHSFYQQLGSRLVVSDKEIFFHQDPR